MPYLLDTNHCSYLMNGLNKQPERRKKEESNTIKVFESLTTETLYMSEVSLGELLYGAEISVNPPRIRQRITDFRRIVVPAFIDEACWEIFARNKAVLEKKGVCPEDFDLLIACIAQRYGAILVSNDSVFKNLPDSFQVENWAADTP